ncbi:MAG: hypothetical protein ACI9EX_000518, partial [Oleispira sp.]
GFATTTGSGANLFTILDIKLVAKISTTKKENTVPIPNAISSNPLETSSDMPADPH